MRTLLVSILKLLGYKLYTISSTNNTTKAMTLHKTVARSQAQAVLNVGAEYPNSIIENYTFKIIVL